MTIFNAHQIKPISKLAKESFKFKYFKEEMNSTLYFHTVSEEGLSFSFYSDLKSFSNKHNDCYSMYLYTHTISYHSLGFPEIYHHLLNHASAFACRNACAWFDLEVENPR